MFGLTLACHNCHVSVDFHTPRVRQVLLLVGRVQQSEALVGLTHLSCNMADSSHRFLIIALVSGWRRPCLVVVLVLTEAFVRTSDLVGTTRFAAAVLPAPVCCLRGVLAGSGLGSVAGRLRASRSDC